MAYDMKSDGGGDCMPCPHCGKKVMLTVGPDAEEKSEPDATQTDNASWEDDLRHEMSPRSGGDEGGM